MSLEQQDVRHVAKLARLRLNDEEVGRFHGELNAIFGWIEQLQEVNTDGVEPMTSVSPMQLPLRQDVVNDGNIQDDVLRNAPVTELGCFAVPKVIE